MKIDLTKLPVLEGVILFLLIALAVAFTAAFITVSDDDDNGSADDNGVVAETPVDTGDTNGTPPGSDIIVSIGDNFFDPDGITVAAGASVTFQLTNDGAAVHNMRVAGADNEYNTDDDTVSDPEVFTAGDAGTLVWTAPASAGEFIFRCDFHPIDMVGTITVQ